MGEEELIIYEMPTIAEFISVNWIQDIIARYLTWKVERKYNRYLRRKRLQNKFSLLSQDK